MKTKAYKEKNKYAMNDLVSNQRYKHSEKRDKI